MSKKKQKKFKDPSNRMERLIFQASFTAAKTGAISGKLDEIIDLLHVLVENTKKPERVRRSPEFNITIPKDAQAAQREWEASQAAYAASRQHLGARIDTTEMPRPVLGSWQRKPKERAAEEVETYHGKATTLTAGGGYVPVRIHQ